jgi:glycosyltransferase involved in cell wall biosynthesis
MKILMIDKYFFIKGGAERYLFEISSILKKKGHKVIPFSMKHENNFNSSFEEFFVDNIDYEMSSIKEKIINSFRIPCRMIYSFQAKERLERLIKLIKPDIAHLHMIDHQISPSILHVLKKYNIPVIQTVHQYKLVCPNYRLFNMRRNVICEKCLSGSFYHPIIERCHKNSSIAGLFLTIEMTIHKAMKIYNNNIDLFHVPSQFMGRMLQKGGFKNNKIEHLYYTLDLNQYLPCYSSDDYFVYYGRLAQEKGVYTLLKAMRNINNSKLLIVGDGPQKKDLESFALKNNLRNVKFMGLKYKEELKSIVSHSKFVIVPSEWHDNSPLVIYESFALGKPVIGSSLGGIPELVTHKETGLLFTAGNSDELTYSIQNLLNHPELIKEYGINAREKAEKEFNPKFHYQELLRKYQRLLNIK